MSLAVDAQSNSVGVSPVRGGGYIRDELARLTSDLVAFKTIEGNFREQERCLDYVAQYVSDVQGLHFSKYHRGDQPYLIISTEDTVTPDVLLSGHVDVVPGADEQFRPRLAGDRLFGRGALDMKGGVAVMMMLLREFAVADGGLSLALMLTSDEEQGAVGANYLVDRYGWQPRFLLIPEGEERFRFVTREKGSCWVRMTAQGAAAHAAYPWRGENALEMLFDSYSVLRALFPAPADEWQSTLVMTQFTGNGNARNQIPGVAEAVLDVRYTNDFARTGSEVVSIFEQAAPGITFELLANGDVLAAPENDPYLRHLHAITERRLGRAVEIGYNHGASDGSAFARYGMPAMTSGIVGKNHHGADEHVLVSSMVDYYRIAEEFIGTWSTVGADGSGRISS